MEGTILPDYGYSLRLFACLFIFGHWASLRLAVRLTPSWSAAKCGSPSPIQVQGSGACDQLHLVLIITPRLKRA